MFAAHESGGTLSLGRCWSRETSLGESTLSAEKLEDLGCGRIEALVRVFFYYGLVIT